MYNILSVTCVHVHVCVHVHFTRITFLILDIINPSNSSSHFSTCPRALEVDITSIKGTTCIENTIIKLYPYEYRAE